MVSFMPQAQVSKGGNQVENPNLSAVPIPQHKQREDIKKEIIRSAEKALSGVSQYGIDRSIKNSYGTFRLKINYEGALIINLKKEQYEALKKGVEKAVRESYNNLRGNLREKQIEELVESETQRLMNKLVSIVHGKGSQTYHLLLNGHIAEIGCIGRSGFIEFKATREGMMLAKFFGLTNSRKEPSRFMFFSLTDATKNNIAKYLYAKNLRPEVFGLNNDEFGEARARNLRHEKERVAGKLTKLHNDLVTQVDKNYVANLKSVYNIDDIKNPTVQLYNKLKFLLSRMAEEARKRSRNGEDLSALKEDYEKLNKALNIPDSRRTLIKVIIELSKKYPAPVVIKEP